MGFVVYFDLVISICEKWKFRACFTPLNQYNRIETIWFWMRCLSTMLVVGAVIAGAAAHVARVATAKSRMIWIQLIAMIR